MIWDVKHEEALPVPEPLNVGLGPTVERRRSSRAFVECGRTDLGSLLWWSAGVRQASNADAAVEFRPVPSAGALHPIHLIIIPPDIAGAAKYDAQRHTLLWLHFDERVITTVRREARHFFDTSRATLIIFAAEPAITARHYDHCESLIWRDSGILQGQLGLVACGLGLAYCLLGTTGHPWLSALFSRPGTLVGTGVGVVGARVLM
jgi:SagB-type dehydrogenase family enzyme